MVKQYYGLRGKRLHTAISTVAGGGFLLFGYDQGVMGGLLTLGSFVKQFPRIDAINTTGSQKQNNSTIQGVVISIYEIGCMIGALSCLYVGEKLGRRVTIFIGAIIMTIGAALQCTSYSLAQLIIGRIVTGLGNGFITATVPTWQSECAKAEHRGALVMFEGALITGGICISYWLDFAFYWLDPNGASWRVPVAFQVILAAFIIATVLPLPESPRWLIKKGRLEEAAQVLAALDDVDMDHPSIAAQIEEIKVTLSITEQASVKDCFSNKTKDRNFWRTSLGFWSQIMQQTSGINLITYYAATVYQTSIGLSELNSKILAAANGTEYFLASFFAIYTIEKIGRRKLMLFGAAGQSLTMVLLVITVYLATPRDGLPFPGKGSSSAGIGAAFLLFAFNTFFAVGWLGMTWLYPAEINGLGIRTAANGIATAGNWVSNFAIVMITPPAFSGIGFYTYSIFAATNFIHIFVVYFLYPETKQRSLEEIDDIFAHPDANPWKPWSVVKVADRLPRRPRVDAPNLDAEAQYAFRHRFGGKDPSEKPQHVEDGDHVSSASSGERRFEKKE